MEAKDQNLSLSSNERIQNIIQEAENELLKIKPEIEYLEECERKLIRLKEQQFKLNSIIVSLKSINKISDVDVNNNFQNLRENDNKLDVTSTINATQIYNAIGNQREIFLPDVAISQVKNYLRTKNNLNYHIFKAVVFNSGTASTEEIKNYLVENNIKQPKTGNGFEKVELKEISSRVNYLVRKQILISVESGVFKSFFGWQSL